MVFDTNMRVRYGVSVDWDSLPKHTNTVQGVPHDVTSLRLRRVAESHRGLRKLEALKTLLVFCPNQACIDEIGDLPALETLQIEETRATDLRPLTRCRSLRHLVVKSATQVADLEWLGGLPPMKAVALSHFPKVSDIEAIVALRGVSAFGFEGDTWTTQRVSSFQPLRALDGIEALFLTNCRPRTGGVDVLHSMHSLRYLEIAGFFPDDDFLWLQRALPQLSCYWFDAIRENGSIEKTLEKAKKG